MKLFQPSSIKKTSSENAFDLGSLFEFSAVVNSSLDIKFIFNHFLLTLMGKLMSLRGIVLLETQPNVFRVENIKGLPSDLLNKDFKFTKIPKRYIYVESKTIKRLPWLKNFEEWGIKLIVPLISQNHIVGLSGFLPMNPKKRLSVQEVTYIKSISNIAAIAIEKGLFISELANVNKQLDRKIQELKTLFELGKEFNSILDPDRIIKLLIYSVMGQIGVNRYAICFLQDGKMKIVNSKLDGKIDDDLCLYFKTISKPLLLDDELNKIKEQNWQKKLNYLGIKAIIPLQLQNETKGLLALGNKLNNEKYTHKDFEFLSSLGNLALISLENVRLFSEALEKQRLENELLIAREIQKGLLPASLPEIPNFEIAATNISSKQVGGDYYDVINLNSNCYMIAIGDVSGKGTPASLLMANLQATIRALIPLGLSLPELTCRVNNLINENTTSGRFITFFWGVLNAEDGILRYVNAGHNPPILIHTDGTSERLDKGGIILGIMKTVVPYLEGEVKFRKGDVLVCFTDGVSEAMNEFNEELGETPIMELTKSSIGESAQIILGRIIDAVKQHSQNTVQSDDITLIVLKAKY